MLVDSVEEFSSSYANGSSDFIITVPLLAGSQAVQIENTGQDWFNISSYDFAPENEALLDSIGLSNNERAYIWIYDTGSQFGQTANGTFSSESVIVKGLDDGSYNIQIYATRQSGGVIEYGQADSISGELTYTLPDFNKDIAVKVRPYCVVDTDDLFAFASYWLLSGPNLAGSEIVDYSDFGVFTGDWLNHCPLGWPF